MANRSITYKQRKYIDYIQEFSLYPLPHFIGTTRGEASDYIDHWKDLASESQWVIEKGY